MTENNTEKTNQAEETVLQIPTEIVETQSEVDALDITAAEANQKDEKPQSGEKAFWKDLIQTIVMAVLIFLVLNTFTSRVKVFNVSMQPTLKQGYLIVVSKMAYKFGSPKRGDIIVFHHAGVEDQDYIKRVIGLPGDVVEISGGVVSINGTPLTEPYIKEMPRYTLTETVPEGKLFVLGDNRNQSDDSHSWGFVDFDWVVGKALFVYWPLDKIKLLTGPDLLENGTNPNMGSENPPQSFLPALGHFTW